MKHIHVSYERELLGNPIRAVEIKSPSQGFDIVRFTLNNELQEPEAEGKLIVEELVDQTFRAYLDKQEVAALIEHLQALYNQMK